VTSARLAARYKGCITARRKCNLQVYMKTVSIVEARRELGRLAERVRRTRQPIALTRRGRVVARIAPEPVASPATSGRAPDAFAVLRGTLRMNCGFDELQRAIRELRSEFARNLDRRAGSSPSSGPPKRG
jgi:prevent-host-death family protein